MRLMPTCNGRAPVGFYTVEVPSVTGMLLEVLLLTVAKSVKGLDGYVCGKCCWTTPGKDAETFSCSCFPPERLHAHWSVIREYGGTSAQQQTSWRHPQGPRVTSTKRRRPGNSKPKKPGLAAGWEMRIGTSHKKNRRTLRPGSIGDKKRNKARRSLEQWAGAPWPSVEKVERKQEEEQDLLEQSNRIGESHSGTHAPAFQP
jgi:hypothetical protein